MVEGARLESVYTGNRIEGSNPFLSAKPLSRLLGVFVFNSFGFYKFLLISTSTGIFSGINTLVKSIKVIDF